MYTIKNENFGELMSRTFTHPSVEDEGLNRALDYLSKFPTPTAFILSFGATLALIERQYKKQPNWDPNILVELECLKATLGPRLEQREKAAVRYLVKLLDTHVAPLKLLGIAASLHDFIRQIALSPAVDAQEEIQCAQEKD